MIRYAHYSNHPYQISVTHELGQGNPELSHERAAGKQLQRISIICSPPSHPCTSDHEGFSTDVLTFCGSLMGTNHSAGYI